MPAGSVQEAVSTEPVQHGSVPYWNSSPIGLPTVITPGFSLPSALLMVDGPERVAPIEHTPAGSLADAPRFRLPVLVWYHFEPSIVCVHHTEAEGWL